MIRIADFFNDNAGNIGKSEHTIRTEEVRISSEFVQLDNADVQDLKPEVKVLPNIVDVYALAIFEHCPCENLTQDDMDFGQKYYLKRSFAEEHCKLSDISCLQLWS